MGVKTMLWCKEHNVPFTKEEHSGHDIETVIVKRSKVSKKTTETPDGIWDYGDHFVAPNIKGPQRISSKPTPRLTDSYNSKSSKGITIPVAPILDIEDDVKGSQGYAETFRGKVIRRVSTLTVEGAKGLLEKWGKK